MIFTGIDKTTKEFFKGLTQNQSQKINLESLKDSRQFKK